MPITLPSMVAVTLYCVLNIIRHFFNDSKKLTTYTNIYDLQLRPQNFMRANNNWMVGSLWHHSLDTVALEVSSLKNKQFSMVYPQKTYVRVHTPIHESKFPDYSLTFRDWWSKIPTFSLTLISRIYKKKQRIWSLADR